jgi:hypothetical protein
MRYRLALLHLWRERQRLERALGRWNRLSAVDIPKIEDETARRDQQLLLQANEDERAVLETQRLYRQAYHYGLSLPQGDVWDTSLRGNRQMLQREALAQLRAAVRAEKNGRWQYWELRSKVLGIVLTAATGAMGALIGVIAIWYKR